MTRLVLASLGDAGALGQKVYEREVTARAASALGTGWTVTTRTVRGLRSSAPGNRRLPARVFYSSSPALRRAAGAMALRRADLTHRMDLRVPPAAGPEVVTIHDVVCWRFPDEGNPPGTVHDEVLRARSIVCPSAFSATEIAATFGIAEPIVIPNGVDERFARAEPLDDQALESMGIRRPFVLHTGGCSLRKNLDGLAASWRIAQAKRPELSLVLAGPPHELRQRLFHDLPGAVLAGRVPDAVLPGLVASATAVVIPSLYEGFGLPALEAMAAGTPVVAVRRSSLPEVCGDAAVLVEPNPDELAEAVVEVCDGGSAVAAMVDRGRSRSSHFTWEASAAAHAAVWQAAL